MCVCVSLTVCVSEEVVCLSACLGVSVYLWVWRRQSMRKNHIPISCPPSFVVSATNKCKHRPKYTENFLIVVTDLEKDEDTHTKFLSYEFFMPTIASWIWLANSFSKFREWVTKYSFRSWKPFCWRVCWNGSFCNYFHSQELIQIFGPNTARALTSSSTFLFAWVDPCSVCPAVGVICLIYPTQPVHMFSSIWQMMKGNVRQLSNLL